MLADLCDDVRLAIAELANPIEQALDLCLLFQRIQLRELCLCLVILPGDPLSFSFDVLGHISGEDEVALGQHREQRPGARSFQDVERFCRLVLLDEQIDVVAVVVGELSAEAGLRFLSASEFAELGFQGVDAATEMIGRRAGFCVGLR